MTSAADTAQATTLEVAQEVSTPEQKMHRRAGVKMHHG